METSQLGPLFNDSGLNLKIGTANVQSIKGKAIALQDYLLDSNLDVFLATETWLKDDDKDKAWLLESGVNKGEFKCLTSNRSGTKKGGGLALIYKLESGIKCKMMDNGERSSFQFAVWKLDIKNNVLTAVRLYHPPTTHLAIDSNAVFIIEFWNHMCNIQLESKNIVILGDFSLHVNDKSDTDTQQFMDVVEASGLKQWVDFPTHKLGNTLDLIITELAAEEQTNNIDCGPYIYDNSIITCTFNLPKQRLIQTNKIQKFQEGWYCGTDCDMDFDSINLDSENLGDSVTV